jgi:hypothetical protein
LLELQQEHIQYLARLVAPSGTVHFADTYLNRYFTDINKKNMLYNIETEKLVFDDAINPVLNKKFKYLKPPEIWTFKRIPEQHHFTVYSHSLERTILQLRSTESIL